MEFLNKTKENLTAAQVCFENGLFNACANRAYYAALQAPLPIKESAEIRLITDRFRRISATN